MTFAERLKIAMKTRGKKAIDIANNCDIDKGNMSRYLSGKCVPKYETIERIALYLNVDITFLLGLQSNLNGYEGSIRNSLIPTQDEIIKNELLREIRVICNDESIESLRTILSVVKTLAKKDK